jgi:hypothetical protein
MPERVCVRVRCLPDGDFCDAIQTSLDGRLLELDIRGNTLPLGSLLEIEQGATRFWGQLQQVEGTSAVVSIEHSLDTSRLQPIRDIWGE